MSIICVKVKFKKLKKITNILKNSLLIVIRSTK